MSDQEKSFEGAEVITLDAAESETVKRAYELEAEAFRDREKAATTDVEYMGKEIAGGIREIAKCATEAAEAAEIMVKALNRAIRETAKAMAELLDKCLEKETAERAARFDDRNLPRPPRRIDATAEWSGRRGGQCYFRNRNREHRDKRQIGGGNI